MAGLASPTHRPLHGDKSKPGFRARRFCVLFGRGVGEVERWCHVHNWGLWDALQTKEMRPGRAESGIGLEKGIGLVHGKRCAALLISRSVVQGNQRRCMSMSCVAASSANPNVPFAARNAYRNMPLYICPYIRFGMLHICIHPLAVRQHHHVWTVAELCL
jgi:hypothetical protein